MPTDQIRDVGNWVLANGTQGVLFASNVLWFFLYLRERRATDRSNEARMKELRERVTAEQANAASLIRVHGEVTKTISTTGALVEFLTNFGQKKE